MLKITNNNKDLAFAILIGGKSTRFGSDKGIFEFLGKPLISYQLETIFKFNKDIYLVANSKEQIQTYKRVIETNKIKDYILDNKELISDKILRTPMIGLYSAFKELDKLGYEKVFTLSCDMPLIKHEVLELILNQSKGFDCCIPRWDNGFFEPLFAIYPVRKALYIAEKNITQGVYKLTSLLDKTWNIRYISIEKTILPLDEKMVTFININGPVDIEKIMNIYRSDS